MNVTKAEFECGVELGICDPISPGVAKTSDEILEMLMAVSSHKARVKPERQCTDGLIIETTEAVLRWVIGDFTTAPANHIEATLSLMRQRDDDPTSRANAEIITRLKDLHREAKSLMEGAASPAEATTQTAGEPCEQ